MIMLDLTQPTALCGGGWCGRYKWACTKCQMGCVQMPNAVSANENGYAQRWD